MRGMGMHLGKRRRSTLSNPLVVPKKLRASSNYHPAPRRTRQGECSVPAPTYLLGRLARRIAGIARGLLLGLEGGELFLFLGLELDHDGGLFGGLACLCFGLLAPRLGLFQSLQPHGLGARGFLGGLLARALV